VRRRRYAHSSEKIDLLGPQQFSTFPLAAQANSTHSSGLPLNDPFNPSAHSYGDNSQLEYVHADHLASSITLTSQPDHYASVYSSSQPSRLKYYNLSNTHPQSSISAGGTVSAPSTVYANHGLICYNSPLQNDLGPRMQLTWRGQVLGTREVREHLYSCLPPPDSHLRISQKQ
jgi:hypothetical protein